MTKEVFGRGQPHTGGLPDSNYARDHQGDRQMTWQATFLSLGQRKTESAGWGRLQVTFLALIWGLLCERVCCNILKPLCHLHSICPLCWSELTRGRRWRLYKGILVTLRKRAAESRVQRRRGTNSTMDDRDVDDRDHLHSFYHMQLCLPHTLII